MNTVFIIIALLSLPLVLLTMYAKTSEGVKIRLGSFFILRKFKSDFLRIRSFRDKISLIMRLCFAAIIVLLVYDPSDIKAPAGKMLLHEPAKENKTHGKYNLKLSAPAAPADSYDEDLYFIQSFIKYKKADSQNITVLYSPTERSIDQTTGNIIIFPAKKQAGSAFLKWIEMLDIAPLESAESKIKNTGITVRNYYPVLIKNGSLVKKQMETDNGTVLAVSFTDRGRNVLLFGTGMSVFWGDLGVSGYFMDIIDNFITGTSLADSTRMKKPDSGITENIPVTSRFSFKTLINIACIVFLMEFVYFILKPVYLKKSLIVFILLLFSSAVLADDFRFIELGSENSSAESRNAFAVIKYEIGDKTSIKISRDYYTVFSVADLSKGRFPDLPYLWITGCNDESLYTQQLAESMKKFMEKGGIIFAELSKGGKSCRRFYRDLAVSLSGPTGLVRLPQDHPVYKSFYLIASGSLSGADISATTKRTALIVSEDNLIQKILMRDERAVKTGVNIVLYMLSGNYKSDQVHARQILERLRKRELYR